MSGAAAEHATPAAAVQLRDVRKSFGNTEIIRGVNLTVTQGERHAVIGPNGAGKSTLFNLISGRFGVSTGAILLNGGDLAGLKPFEINRRGLARSFQITNIFANLSVFENIRCAVLYPLGYKYSFWKALSTLKDANARADEVLERIVSQVANPVRWDLCMKTLQELGVTGVIELAPAGTLVGLLKRATPEIETFAFKSPADLAAAKEFAEKHK